MVCRGDGGAESRGCPGRGGRGRGHQQGGEEVVAGAISFLIDRWISGGDPGQISGVFSAPRLFSLTPKAPNCLKY